MERLPSRWQDLDPRWLELALQGEQPGKEPQGLSLAQVLAFASTIPQRSTNRNLQRAMSFSDAKTSNVGCDLLGLLRGLVKDMVDTTFSPAVLKNLQMFDIPRSLCLKNIPSFFGAVNVFFCG